MQDVRIGVTSSRRAKQLADALRRKGADVTVGPTLGGDRPQPDEDIALATDRIVSAQPSWFVATTGMGMGLWVEAAERTGRMDALRDVVHGARRVARGAKAVGGLRQLDADAEHVPDEQTDAAVVAWLRERVDSDEVVAVQLHGSPSQHPYGLLADDANLVTITPYRSVLPDDTAPASALIRATLDGDIDVLTFTSPAAVRGLFDIADTLGPDVRAQLHDVLGESVAIAAIGHVTASALDHADVPVTITPERPRTAALIRAVEDWAG